MELYGLKNKDGKEYKITMPYSPLPNCVGNCTFCLGDLTIKPVDIEPVFKTGDWVRSNIDGSVQRIREINGNNLRYMDGSYEEEFKHSISHATPQEIEQHLRKICDEKYIGKKAKCLDFDDYHYAAKFHLYDVRDDVLYYETLKRDCVCLYRKGKFAEIIPEKKKLPKTKEALMSFVLEDLHPFFYDSDLPKIMKIINDHEDT